MNLLISTLGARWRGEGNFGMVYVFNKYAHPSLAAGSYSESWQIRGVAQTIRIYNLDPSMDRSVKIVRQLRRVMFKELEGGV